jgi:hypothetical protein
MDRRWTLLAVPAVIAVVVLALASSTPRPFTRPPATPRALVPHPSEMFGVSVNRVFNDDLNPAHWDASLAAVRASGIRQARGDAFWMWAEPSAPVAGVHEYRWALLDAQAAALAKHGLRWLPVLDYSALWAASDRSDYHSPPISNDDYAAYAKAFAERYGQGGAFWAQHPELTPLPVTTYEIWNEPNGSWAWRPAPDAAVYADMYLRARAAIHAVDRGATVVVGGLVAHTRFVRLMYAARPDLRGHVDAIGWHAYAPTVNEMIGGVRALRDTLDQLGETGVPIFLTEIGWPTSGKSPIVLGEAARAASLEAAADAFARSDCGVAAVIAYTWMTPEKNPATKEDWYGIRHPDGRSSTTSDAFARVVARWQASPVTPASRVRLCHP